MSTLTEMLPAYCEMLNEVSKVNATMTRKYIICQIIRLANNAITTNRAFVLEQIAKLSASNQIDISTKIYWT